MKSAQAQDVQLRRNDAGRLVLTDADGSEHTGVIPVRAFPIAAPDEGIALVSADGRELAWIGEWSAVTDEVKSLIEQDLAAREFMPQILQIHGVSSFATPSVWTVSTDRGETAFTLKGEEDIRRLPQSALLIADSHGIQFLIRDTKALDKASRKILDRFL